VAEKLSLRKKRRAGTISSTARRIRESLFIEGKKKKNARANSGDLVGSACGAKGKGGGKQNMALYQDISDRME